MRFLAALSSAVFLFTSMCASRPPAADAAAAGEPTYTSQPGDLPVGVIPEATLTDPQRNREIDLTIEYPIKDGSYPVVVFSTGFGAPSRTYVGLSAYWASHGYIVMKVGHPETETDMADIAAVWKDQTPADWRNRTADMKYVIDSLTSLADRYTELKGKMDENRLGVGGHSYGAFVAMLLAGARTFTNGVPTSYADPRIKAVIAMSPQGPSELRGLTTESWREVNVPIMYMTGSTDIGITETENESWRKQAFELSPPGDKWFVSIAGAGHFAFTGRTVAPVATVEPDMRVPVRRGDPRPLPDPADEPNPLMPRRVDTGFYSARQSLNVIRVVSVAFWDAYLANEEAAREYLAKLKERGDMTVESK